MDRHSGRYLLTCTDSLGPPGGGRAVSCRFADIGRLIGRFRRARACSSRDPGTRCTLCWLFRRQGRLARASGVGIAGGCVAMPGRPAGRPAITGAALNAKRSCALRLPPLGRSSTCVGGIGALSSVARSAARRTVGFRFGGSSPEPRAHARRARGSRARGEPQIGQGEATASESRLRSLWLEMPRRWSVSCCIRTSRRRYSCRVPASVRERRAIGVSNLVSLTSVTAPWRGVRGVCARCTLRMPECSGTAQSSGRAQSTAGP